MTAGVRIYKYRLLPRKAQHGRLVAALDHSRDIYKCGQVKPKLLSERLHRCDCGCVLDRDVAAARVILHRAVAGPSGLNLGVA